MMPYYAQQVRRGVWQIVEFDDILMANEFVLACKNMTRARISCEVAKRLLLDSQAVLIKINDLDEE